MSSASSSATRRAPPPVEIQQLHIARALTEGSSGNGMGQTVWSDPLAFLLTEIRSSGEFDALIDFDAVIRDPDDPDAIFGRPVAVL